MKRLLTLCALALAFGARLATAQTITFTPNVMTGPGDLIGGTTAGAAARVAGGKTGQILSATNGGIPSFISAGVAVCNGGSEISSTPYTVLSDSVTATRDRGATCGLVSGASVVVIPDPTDSGVGVGFPVKLFDISAGAITVNHETSATFTVVNGSSVSIGVTTFSLANGQTAVMNAVSSTVYYVQIVQVPVAAQSLSNASHRWFNSYSATTGLFTQTQPACGDLSDAVSTCNTAPTLAQTLSNSSNKWLNSYNATTGLFTQTQPSCGNLSDAVSTCNVLPTLAQTLSNSSNKWLNSYNATTGLFTQTQPGCGNLSDAAATCSALPTWGQISSTPTTLAGYGITDAVPNTRTINTHALSSNVVISASDLTTGTIPCAQQPPLTGNVTSSGCATTVAVTPAASMTAATNFTWGTTPWTNANMPVVQNAVKVTSFVLPGPQTYTFSNIAVQVTTIDNTSNSYDIGIYGPGCLNGAASIPLVAHTGTKAGSAIATATGLKLLALTSAPVTGILPGYYCYALTSSAPSPLLVLGGNGNAVPSPFDRVSIAAVGGATLPSTITAPALSWALSFNGGGTLY